MYFTAADYEKTTKASYHGPLACYMLTQTAIRRMFRSYESLIGFSF